MRLIDADELITQIESYIKRKAITEKDAKIFELICGLIDNAPTVETDIEVVAKDAYEHGYTDGWKERFGEPEERPQGEYKTACNVLLSLEQIVRSSDGWEDSAVESVHNSIQTAIKALEIVDDVNHKVYRNENCPQKHKCYDYQGYHCAGCSWEKKGGAE